MLKPILTGGKGDKYIVIGALGAIFFDVLSNVVGSQSSPIPPLAPFAEWIGLVTLPFFALMAYGCWLVLKVKNRSKWWMLLVIPGFFTSKDTLFITLFIFFLENKTAVQDLASQPK